MTETKVVGEIQTVFLSSMLGILALAFVNLGAETSPAFQSAVWSAGKRVLPGAEGIGPYSGKQVLSLGIWLLSWLILRPVLIRKTMPHHIALVLFLLGVGFATTLLWPPVTHLAAEALKTL